jgi:hypothetical protein
MAEQTVAKRPESPARRIVRLLVITAIGFGAIALGTYFQEDIQRYIRLRAWDKSAPGRAVTAFLEAAKEGNGAEADRYLGSPDFQPLKMGDKHLGYFIATPAGTMDFKFEDLAPQGEVQVSSIKFVMIGEGAAEVETSQGNGETGKYRLKMINSEWKITDILSGAPRQSSAPPSDAAPPKK